MTLELIRAPAGWRARLDACRAKGQRVGLVLTMGALHAGHLSLIRRAAADCGVVAVTDYVNPLQFGPTEDLSAYPRRLDEDCRLAAGAGANLVFAPTTDDLWSEPPRTTVRVEGLTDRLEGLSRPGHFDGVATIVVKLFALAGPCWAYFGEKDFQQLAVIRRLVEDLSVPVEIFGCPIVRDPDGLALSSRNAYLTPEERQVAPRLYSALLAGKRAIEDDAFRRLRCRLGRDGGRPGPHASVRPRVRRGGGSLPADPAAADPRRGAAVDRSPAGAGSPHRQRGRHPAHRRRCRLPRRTQLVR